MIANNPVVLTGDIRIDALLAAPQDSLAFNHVLGKAVTVTYSFNGYTAAQTASVTNLLNEISSVSGVTFKQVAQGGVLTYNYYTNGHQMADGSDSTGFMRLTDTDAEVYLNANKAAMLSLDGGYGRQVALHETLHALGLKHPGHYSDEDSGPVLPTELATAAHTVMAYNGGDNSHLGDYDILSLQYLYGQAGNKAQSVINLTSVNTGGSLFNDTFKLDVSKLGTSVRVEGGKGCDELYINVASKDVKVVGLNQFTYTKADGSFAGVYLDSVERIHFTDTSLALDVNGDSAAAYRLYEAAFDRKPDLGGLGYWIGQMDQGMSLQDVSQSFLNSKEFQQMYGSAPSNVSLVDKLYHHVLDRAPDQGGLNYWVDQLNSGTATAAQVLTGFSESVENQITVTGQIQAGIEYHMA